MRRTQLERERALGANGQLEPVELTIAGRDDDAHDGFLSMVVLILVMMVVTGCKDNKEQETRRVELDPLSTRMRTFRLSVSE